MSTKLKFTLSADGEQGMTLNLEHSLLFPDTWDDNNGTGHCIIGAAGNVDSSSGTKLVCQSGPPDNQPCVTLNGASWGSGVGDTGAATVDLANPGCPSDWTWTVASKS